MLGQTFLMEFRTGWKIFLIFSLIIWISAAGIVQMYPSFRDTLIEELEGADKVDIVVPENQKEDIQLSWEPIENTTGYVVLMDNRSTMLTSSIIYIGNETSVNITYDFEEKRYFAVMAIINGSDQPTFIGMATTAEGEDPFQDLLNNPGYSGLTRGRKVSFVELKGFITYEFFSWFWMLAGFFLAYFSVSVVTTDFEGKRMDLIFSTPISRRRYMLEKFAALSAVSFILVFVAALGLIQGVYALGMADELDSATLFMAMLTALPFLMVICAFGMLCGIVFNSGKVGMGLSFGFLIGAFILLTFSGFSESIDWMKYLSVMFYWDYGSVIFDGIFQAVYFLELLIFSGVLMALAIYLFEKMDIPA